MRLVGRPRLLEFESRHPAVRSWVRAWTKEVLASDWKSPQEVKDRYASASIVNSDVVIFNVKGNAYRLEVRIAYAQGVVEIVRCGTHAEYDRWS